MKIWDLIWSGLILILISSIFNQWFSATLISGGDLQVYYKEMLQDFYYLPLPAWNWSLGTGFGAYGASFLWNYVAVFVPINLFGNIFRLDWPVIQRIAYFYPLILIFFASVYLFYRPFLNYKNMLVSFTVFFLNTYVLMLIGGGQIFIALAYALTPLVFYFFIRLFEDSKKSRIKEIQNVFISGSILALQALLDIRISYITVVGLLIFYIFSIKKSLYINFKNLFLLFLSFLISGSLHFFWILPTILFRQNPLVQLGSEYVTTSSVKFFSFAKFENTVSLLHPNWPENIFGKVEFIRPEFLIFPIIAFSSLVFINKNLKIKKYILFFSILSLIGAFLAKGANEPFGEIYLWMFSNIPGFMMFRDPTKWYLLVAFSYSFLIPFFLLNFSKVFKIYKLDTILMFLFFLIWIFSIKDVFLGNLKGTFQVNSIPPEYINLKEFIKKDDNFFRIMWIPRTQNFTYYSRLHPAVIATDFYKTSSPSAIFSAENLYNNLLRESAIRFIIIPYDSKGEIFLTDREYDEIKYEKTIKEIRKIKWLEERDGFGKIKVFELSGFKDHFWSTSKNLELDYKYINPSKYEVILKNVKKNDILIFSESFDKYWLAKNNEIEIRSQKYNNLFNSFSLPKNGNYTLTIYYAPQDWVNIGVVISLISLISIIGFLGFGLIGRK